MLLLMNMKLGTLSALFSQGSYLRPTPYLSALIFVAILQGIRYKTRTCTMGHNFNNAVENA